MESNAQTQLTSKMETESWIETRLTALGGVEGWRDEQKRIITHGHGPQCGDFDGGKGGVWKRVRG